MNEANPSVTTSKWTEQKRDGEVTQLNVEVLAP